MNYTFLRSTILVLLSSGKKCNGVMFKFITYRTAGWLTLSTFQQVFAMEPVFSLLTRFAEQRVKV